MVMFAEGWAAAFCGTLRCGRCHVAHAAGLVAKEMLYLIRTMCSTVALALQVRCLNEQCCLCVITHHTLTCAAGKQCDKTPTHNARAASATFPSS